MEPEGSLPHSQVPANCPYPTPARSTPYPYIYFLKIQLNIILPSTPGSLKWSLSLRLVIVISYLKSRMITFVLDFHHCDYHVPSVP